MPVSKQGWSGAGDPPSPPRAPPSGATFDPYRHREHLGKLLARIRNGDLPEGEKKLLLDYHDDCRANGLSHSRIIKFLTYLLQLRGWLGVDLAAATLEDIKRVIREIEDSDYALYTKNDYKITLKKFYQWLRKTGDGYPPEVAWIKVKAIKGIHKLPEDLITEEEKDKLVKACYNQRDRALISFLYESGCRVGELLSLLRKHIAFVEGGAAVTIPRGKTGARRIKVVASSPHLALWLKEHPFQDPEAPLWVVIQKGHDGASRRAARVGAPEPLDYPSVKKLLKVIAKRAGVQKRVNPHSFRHARATELAKDLTEAEMKAYLGWVQGSDMAAIYVHLSGRDTDPAIDRMYGIETKEEDRKKPQRPPTCPRCKFINPVGMKFCGECTAPLDIRTLMDLEETVRPVENLVATAREQGYRSSEELEEFVQGIIRRELRRAGVRAAEW